MSRVGKRPIAVPSGVSVSRSGESVQVKGPKGTLSERVPAGVSVEIEATEIRVLRGDEKKETRSRHGLARALLANMVAGVTEGFTRELEIHGVGYRAEVGGKTLKLALGFSHPVDVAIPEGLAVSVQENRVRIEGADRRLVGQFAAEIRSLRPPEPYKGKGIRYADEHVRRKVGKAGGGLRNQSMERKVRDLKQGKQLARKRRVARRLARSTRTQLSVYRSAKHIYAQLIDPMSGRTLGGVSTRSQAIGGELSATGNVEAAKRVGKAIAELARSKEIEAVVFNRNGFLYHGRVKALAEAAREAGLRF